jgi:hypothetical protein
MRSKKDEMSKKGQVALWVILSVVLAAAVILFYTLERKPIGAGGVEFSPRETVEKCIREGIEEAVDRMLPQGGFIEPKNYFVYNKTKIEYLCEYPYYFRQCIHQHPMLMKEMNEEIEKYLLPIAENCFEEMKREAERKQNSIEMEGANLSIEMAPGRIYARINKKVIITGGGAARAFDNFDVEFLSPAYELASAAMDIAASEAKYCYFENLGYMLEFPKFDIRKIALSEPIRIYSIKDIKSGKTMNIAIRSCAIAAGMRLK